MILALGRGVDIEGLPLVLRLGVSQVTMDLGIGGEERGGEEQDDHEEFHVDVPTLQ